MKKTCISVSLLSLIGLAALATIANAQEKIQPPQSRAQSPRYDCQAQTSSFSERKNVNQTEALKLVQQLNGDQFVYHCRLMSKMASVSGTVTYRQRVALPPNAQIEVKLVDVSRADAPAIVLAAQTIPTSGKQVPIPFTLAYDASIINPSHRYAVQARILIGNQLRWISTSAYSVITQGNPTIVQIVVDPVSSQPSSSNPDPTRLKTPGWGAWLPISKLKDAHLDSGFSNSELGGYLDFQNYCAQATGQPMEAFPNWFRSSRLVDQIGTGQIEFGCWVTGKFINTITNTAIKNDLKEPYCLKVVADQGLVIYSEPKVTAKSIGRLRRGETVKPNSLPALITETDGENWVAIQSPIEGWIVQGQPDSLGNLQLCQ